MDAGNHALVRHWSDRAGSEEFDAVVPVRDEVIAGREPGSSDFIRFRISRKSYS